LIENDIEGSSIYSIVSSPSWTIDRTFRLVFDLPETRKESKRKSSKPKKLYRNPIFLAREWQEKLENGECSSRADLARKLGVSRARVTQILRLLRINTEVLKTISELGDPLPSPIITERKLRPIVDLPIAEQRQIISAMLS
jgi:hypothetical protein